LKEAVRAIHAALVWTHTPAEARRLRPLSRVVCLDSEQQIHNNSQQIKTSLSFLDFCAVWAVVVQFGLFGPFLAYSGYLGLSALFLQFLALLSCFCFICAISGLFGPFWFFCAICTIFGLLCIL